MISATGRGDVAAGNEGDVTSTRVDIHKLTSSNDAVIEINNLALNLDATSCGGEQSIVAEGAGSENGLCQLCSSECITESHIVALGDGDNTKCSTSTNCFTEGDRTIARSQGEGFTGGGFNSNTCEVDVSSGCTGGNHRQPSTNKGDRAVTVAGVEQDVGTISVAAALSRHAACSRDRCGIKDGGTSVGGDGDGVGVTAISTSKIGGSTVSVDSSRNEDEVTGGSSGDGDAAGIAASDDVVIPTSRDQISIKINVAC